MKIGKGWRSIISALSGVTVGAVGMNIVMKKSADEKQIRSDKRLALFMMMNQWVRIKQEGKNLSDYFVKNQYQKIAIYGMGYAGETLLAELKDSDIKVAYGIDRNADRILLDIDILTLENSLPEADVIVVTAITYFDEIEKDLAKKTNIKVISLEDVLNNVLYEV